MTHSMLSHYSYPTPHGPITICVSERGVRAIAFGEVQLAGARRPTELSNRCATELLEYFAGKRTAFDVPLDPEGSEFQKSVWEALSRVPFATSVTSGDLARELGKPKSYRAVGAAVRENPLAVIVPDHRVVRANGRPLAADARGRIREGLLHMERERAGLNEATLELTSNASFGLRAVSQSQASTTPISRVACDRNKPNRAQDRENRTRTRPRKAR